MNHGQRTHKIGMLSGHRVRRLSGTASGYAPPGHHNSPRICPCSRKQVACRPGKAVDHRPLLGRDDLQQSLQDDRIKRSNPRSKRTGQCRCGKGQSGVLSGLHQEYVNRLCRINIDNQVCTPCIPISLNI